MHGRSQTTRGEWQGTASKSLGRGLWLALLLAGGCAGTLEDPERFLEAASSGGTSTTDGSSSSSSTSSGSSSSSGSSRSGGSTSDSSSSSGSSSSGSSSTSAPPAPCDAPTLIFDTICNQCHSPAPYNLGALDLVSANVAVRLVDIQPPLCETGAGGGPQYYVVPGHPEASYLYEKVSEAHPNCGQQMPQNEALSDADQQCIFGWIYNLDGGG